MLSSEGQQIKAALLAGRATEPADVPVEVMRRDWEAGAAQVPLPPAITTEPVDAAGVAGLWVSSPEAVPDRVLLYFHGGGYNAGSALTHQELGARLCLASEARVLLLNYHLAPEHPFPAAITDAVAGYTWLLGQGIGPGQIVVGGDSSGGGLAVGALLALRDQGIALPAGGVLLSPWLDQALTGPTLEMNAAHDPLCSVPDLRRAAAWYLAGADPQHPWASPLYADLRGLPPLLIHAGGDEILLSDATRFAERARAAGVTVQLEVWTGLWHVWHAWAGELPEGAAAIRRIGAFMRKQLGEQRVAAPSPYVAS